MNESRRGTFIISFDTELAWGTRGRRDLIPDYERTREVIQRLLSMLDRYKISATWAVVGHLFLDHCERVNGVAHPDVSRPSNGGGDWFDADPCSSVSASPLWYGPDIVKQIQSCATKQEIGSHSFAHIRVDVDGYSAKDFSSDLDACRAVARGTELVSYVYPENRVALVDELPRHGFRSFRAANDAWYERLPRPWSRLGHLLDQMLNPSAPSVSPKKHGDIWELPGSMYFAHAHGWGAMLPPERRERKAMNGIRHAEKKGNIFHLWTHPFNIASDPEKLLPAFVRILAFAAAERDAGRLDILTMEETTQRLNRL